MFKERDLVDCLGEIRTVQDTDGLMLFVRSQSGAGRWMHSSSCAAVTFPIPADKDPWRESEPDAGDDDENVCLGESGSHGHLVCTRAVAHSGCHVARDDEGVVYARWPNEAAQGDASKAKYAAKDNRVMSRFVSKDGLGKQEPFVQCHRAIRMCSDGAERVYRYEQHEAGVPVYVEESERAPMLLLEDPVKLKRELENLRRESEAKIGDLAANWRREEAIVADLRVQVAWLERENARLTGKRK